VQDGEVVWLPPGTHVIESGAAPPSLAVLDFNGALEDARVEHDGVEIAYQSGHRALALLNRRPARAMVDGRASPLDIIPAVAGRFVVTLPRGKHRVSLQ
jgi:hypothetical protein